MFLTPLSDSVLHSLQEHICKKAILIRLPQLSRNRLVATSRTPLNKIIIIQLPKTQQFLKLFADYPKIMEPRNNCCLSIGAESVSRSELADLFSRTEALRSRHHKQKSEEFWAAFVNCQFFFFGQGQTSQSSLRSSRSESLSRSFLPLSLFLMPHVLFASLQVRSKINFVANLAHPFGKSSPILTLPSLQQVQFRKMFNSLPLLWLSLDFLELLLQQDRIASAVLLPYFVSLPHASCPVCFTAGKKSN